MCLIPGMPESVLEAISLASVMLKVPAGTRGNYSDKRKVGSTLLWGAGETGKGSQVHLKRTLHSSPGPGSFDVTQDHFSCVTKRKSRQHGKAEEAGFAEKYIKQTFQCPF